MSAATHLEYRTFSSCWRCGQSGEAAITKRKKRKISPHRIRFFKGGGKEKHKVLTHRLPRPTVLEDVQDVEERGGGDELLGRLARRDTTSILVIRGGENPQGEVLHV